MMNLLVHGGLVLSVSLQAVLCSQFDLESYVKLPRIYEYDDFETCRLRYTSFVYCVSVSTLTPNATSELWNNMTRDWSDRRNFPHDQLERGLCLNDYHIEAKHPDDASFNVANYLSKQIYDRYGLSSRTTVSTCWTRQSFSRQRTVAENMFICMALVLLTMILFTTWMDFSTGSKTLYVKAFSLRKTVGDLTKPANSNAMPFLEGLRVLGTMTILIVHSQLPMIRMPIKNTEYLEAQVNHVIFPLFNSGNTHMIQFFFTLGGMVFGLSCFNHFERTPTFDVMYFAEKLIRRLVRLIPAYFFIIFYQATWYKRVKQGPLEHKFYDYCSENWWTNVLFVNNYVLPTKPFGWYLGADFHLFLVGSLLLMLVWKYPRLQQTLVSGMVAAAVFIPGYVIYVQSIGATMSFDMRHALAELRTYDHFIKYYLPSHTNISGYFFGIIAAMCYKRVIAVGSQDRIVTVLRRGLRLSLIVLISLNLFTIALPTIRIDKNFSIFHAIYGSLLKASWGFSYGVLFLFLALKSKSQIVDLLVHPVMQFFAKISYCIYLVQYSIIYGVYTNFPIPLVYGSFNLIFLTSSIFLLTIISAILLHVAVEAPIAHIANAYITMKFRQEKQNDVALQNRSKQS